ncbi:MAG TPA: hypothetical protein PK771_02880 [Spirochaetota bacterium]|nr:hypothetical protein [Spirochaetota bacterium]
MKNIKIIQNPKNISIHEISNDIKILLKDEDNLIKHFNIVYNGEKYLYFSENNSFSIMIDGTKDEGVVFLLKNLYVNKKPDIKKSYKILLISEKIYNGVNEDFFYKIFPIIGWQTFKKGLDYFKKLKSMESALSEKVLNKKVSIVEAILFHDYFQKDYSDFIEKLSGDLTFSEYNQVLRNLTEFSGKNNLTLYQVENRIEFSNKKYLIDSIFNLKFSDYKKIKKRFDTFINDFNFQNGVEIIYDESFEKENYALKINFTDIKSLAKKVEKVKDSIDKFILSDKKDMFNQDFLFEEDLNDK